MTDRLSNARAAAAGVGAAGRLARRAQPPRGIKRASDGWLNELAGLVGCPESARGANGRSRFRRPVARYAARFASVMGMVDARRESQTELAADWASADPEAQRRALFEFWLSDRPSIKRSGRRQNDARIRQRMCAILRRCTLGVWYQARIASSVAYGLGWSTDRGKSALQPRMALVLDDLRQLGAIDLGYDERGRLVALRLTERGAHLIAASPDPGQDVATT